MILLYNTTYTDIKAFLHGYKPAFTFTPHYIPPYYVQKDIENLANYPCIKQIKPHNKEADIYFQNKNLKQAFQEKIKGLNQNSPEFHRILGETLGFPPLAVDFYVKHLQELVDWNRKVGFEYNGINFAGSFDTLIECTYWLWEQYPQQYFREREMILSYGKPSNRFKIAYKDINKLRTVHEQISKLIKKASA